MMMVMMMMMTTTATMMMMMTEDVVVILVLLSGYQTLLGTGTGQCAGANRSCSAKRSQAS